MPKFCWEECDSSISDAISSRRIECSSEVFMYLSRAMRASMRSMILTVVSTPTSEVMSTSSSWSSTSASTVDRPAMARVSFEKKPLLVFSRPASSSRCSACCTSSWGAAAALSCFFLNRSKNPILSVSMFILTKVRKIRQHYKLSPRSIARVGMRREAGADFVCRPYRDSFRIAGMK